MGFNSTVIVRNDALGCIKADPEFGKKVADAIGSLSHIKKGIDIASGYNANAATVVETHHASNTAIVAVGGNHATVIGWAGDVPHHEEAGQIDILRELAEKLGYRLVKKPKAKTVKMTPEQLADAILGSMTAEQLSAAILGNKIPDQSVELVAPTGLACGLTPQAIKVYELSKTQQQEQAKVD